MKQYDYSESFEQDLIHLIDSKEEVNLDQSLQALGEALKLQKLKGTLYPFGSYCNGFKGKTTDLDCVFLTPSDDKPQSLFRQVGTGLKAYEESNKFPQLKVIGYIMQAKVPILKIQDVTNNIQIDLSINNINGICNSKLLYEYSQIHPKIQQLGLLLKLWGKNNRLIISGSLTSYSMILLLIHFLQVKYDVPYLSDVSLNQNQFLNLEFIENNPFFLVGIKKDLPKLTQTSIQQILYEFFEFYETNGEFQKQNIRVSLRKISRENGDKIRTIRIDDPINLRYDPSKRFQTRCLEFQELFSEGKKCIGNHDLSTFSKKEKLEIHKQAKKKKKINPDLQTAFKNFG